MVIDGPIPGGMLSTLAVATIALLMFHVGVTLAPGEYRAAWRAPGPLLRALFASLVAVPAVVIAVARLFELPRAAEVGMVIMAISPGAPLALRRSLGAGADRAFASGLQVTTAILAVATMPLSVAALDEFYGASAAIEPLPLAIQVFLGQLLPLSLGIGARHAFGELGAGTMTSLERVEKALLIALCVLLLVDAWSAASMAGWRVAVAIACATLCALAIGHLLCGPSAALRTAGAVSSAARNAGTAMLVATINHATPATGATIVAYLVIAALTITPYLAWRRRTAPGSGAIDEEAQNTNLP